ncbi:hypothetical protein F8M49_29955 [Rhodococcus zopfii]|uniref:Uncharacterized protein n=1 Tax=Rhodococcus zopfii TaxID=43772 RepID=A0ABU3WX54_9NOCA|nr:hypothetical protein [Rhodococcus zopfii]
MTDIDVTPTAPEIPGMEHAGWICNHELNDKSDVHTNWRPRKRKPGWKRKKSPGVIRSIEPVSLLQTGSRPSEPGCHKARPLYEKLDDEQTQERLERNPRAVYAINEHFENPENVVRAPRQWDDLRDIPDDVHTVHDSDGRPRQT